ncbi:MAG TPA: carboxyl transferase domain-containing protein [Acidimicrobiia bacterium]|jgi:acetyl-CoA carboxylase carboxyltransferase component
MPTLPTRIDRSAPEFQANRSAMLEKLAEFEQLQAAARMGGGEKYVERHHRRGKLLARERIELLLDPDSYFLELSTLAAWGTDKNLGANAVTGIGVVNGVECVLSANDPTSQAGSSNRYSLAKTLRAQDIARENRLPLINLVESGGADLPDQAEVFISGGKWFRNLTQLSRLGIPTVALVFGSSTAGGAYVPAMCDYAVMVKGQAKVFLGGPPLVKMATGEESTDEELGGAEMHSRISGLSDYFAEDELDAIRIGRQIIGHLNWRKLGYGPTQPADEPVHDLEDLLGLIPADLRVPFDMREVLGRVLDGSRFEEYKPLYGPSMLTGWGSVHGFPIGVVANQQGVIFSAEAQKATEFIQLCNRYDQPILFVHNTTGYMVGRDYEQAGIIKDGAKMINAVANSAVPHLALMAGVSYGAGNYGMSGRSYNPRFVFGWPGHKVAVMGPRQLAGVMSIIARSAAAESGREFDEEEDARRTEAIEGQIGYEEQAYFSTARVRDDGLIDPRQTRTALGIALSAVHSAPVVGTDRFGVFRM